jgi:SAM-dependent methyltransferase
MSGGPPSPFPQAAPPAPDAWYEPAAICWCGGGESGPSPCSSDYWICERCGTHVARRRLRAERVTDFYSLAGYWQARQSEKAHPTLLERGAVLERDGRVDAWLSAIDAAIPGPPGLAIEIGCAEGTLLRRLASRGWRCVGLEPDPATAAAVRDTTGLEIRSGVFPGASLPPCDLLAACDVLEHALDPAAFIREAARLVRPGGLLFLQLPLMVPGQPDFGGITPKVFDPWEHSFIFTRSSVATLLAAEGFRVLNNDQAWIRAHEFVVARRVPDPPTGFRPLANVREMLSAPWRGLMDELNAFARPLGLREFRTWSKIWEYPALWHGGLSRLDWSRVRLVDIGSELSPFPWWLAARGAQVTLVETSPDYVRHWEFVRERLGGPSVDWRVVASADQPFSSGSVDVVTSLSVVEHQADKRRALAELARILRPGGLLALSFDLAEPELGMTFPEWNGRALTRREFTDLVADCPELEPATALLWNEEDIGPFLEWHRQTAPHHNYVTGAAILRRLPSGWRLAGRRLRHASARLQARFAR